MTEPEIEKCVEKIPQGGHLVVKNASVQMLILSPNRFNFIKFLVLGGEKRKGCRLTEPKSKDKGDTNCQDLSGRVFHCFTCRLVDNTHVGNGIAEIPCESGCSLVVHSMPKALKKIFITFLITTAYTIKSYLSKISTHHVKTP